jgi:PAS domain S-box-containing protein
MVWLPVPVLLLVITVLWVAEAPYARTAPYLLLGLNFAFSTVSSLLVAYLAARSFLAQNDPSVLLLGCGVLIWGVAGVASNLASPRDANGQVTIYNLSVWVSALCHLAGLVLSLRGARLRGPPELWLPAAYALAVLCVGLAVLAHASHELPPFFIEGEGGTPIRQLVLGSAIGMFGFTSGLLAVIHRRSSSRFLLWYAPALGLLAVGLFGVMVQTAHGSLPSWTGRASQWLGGVYMFFAGLAVARAAHAWSISLEARLRMSEEKLAVSENTLSSIYSGVEAAITLSEVIGEGAEFRFVSANRACVEWSGISLERWVGGGPRDILPEAQAEQVCQRYRETVRQGRSLHYEELLTFPARRIWALTTVSPVRDAGGAIRRLVATSIDITERKRVEQANEELARQRQLALEAARLGWWRYDPAADAAVWDQRVAELFGITAHQATLEELLARVHPGDAPQVRAALAAALDPVLAKPYHVQYRVLRKGDETRWIEAYGLTTFEGGGEQRRAASIVGTVQDITERREFQAELERLVTERTAKLRELVGELEHFSYTITHDMRAPLRAMRGFAEMAAEYCPGDGREEPREFLRRIGVAADRMDNLITDALNYSRIVRQELALTPVDVGALLRGMLDSYPELQPSRAHIHIERPMFSVMGNPAALTQCFSNLLGNAVKFVRPGDTPRVRVWSEQRGEWVRIWVEDEGIGIAGAMMPRLFQMFSRGHTSYEGTGIGLALVRKVVERMGGRVGVESTEGRGSRFWVELKGASASEPGGGAS